MKCINCDVEVYLDEDGFPVSKYWIANKKDCSIMDHPLCGPLCSTEYRRKNDEAK